MKSILVPVQLQSNYANLIDYSIALAKKSRAHVTFLVHDTSSWLKQVSRSAVASQTPSKFVEPLIEQLESADVDFTLKNVKGRIVTNSIRECQNHSYDLLLLGSFGDTGPMAYIQRAYISKIIGEVEVPMLFIPNGRKFTHLENITYATDLTDYDPRIIQQVKSIAGLFDANLSVVHINVQEKEQQIEREKYLLSLEQTISDTLDYPKIYYKFFDHSDTFTGIKKFVKQNNIQMIAMTNRKKFSWSDLFSGKSLTRKVAHDLSVPLLAFSKFSS